MYKLTLTKDERKAIDWIGYRYSNGDDLKSLLVKCDYVSDWYTSNAWDEAESITFNIPENIAWEIADNAGQEDGDSEYNFPCFSPELTEKLFLFCIEII